MIPLPPPPLEVPCRRLIPAPTSTEYLLTAALIHPDGHLSTLRGEFKSDPASIAALGHAVHAAGNELAIRAGTAPVQCVTLHGPRLSLTLLPVPQGVLLLEHDPAATPASVQATAKELLAQPAPPLPPAPPTAPISLADALHATAP